MRNLRLNSPRVGRYGTHLNGDMCATGMDKFRHNPAGRSSAIELVDASWDQMDGSLRITKRGCSPKQPNSPSLLTITTCRSGSAMPLSITSSLIDSIRGTMCSGRNRRISPGFSVERSGAQFRNLTTFNRLDAMQSGFHPSLQVHLTTATMRQIIIPLNLDSARTQNW